MNFKVGDWVVRTERGKTRKHEITIGKSYSVRRITKSGQLEIINDEGMILAYMPRYFKLDKNRMVKQILNDL